MSRTDDTAVDETPERTRSGGETRSEQERRERRGPTEWFAESAIRLGLALVGFVLLLFALGQAVGFDLLGIVIDAVNSTMGRWLIVAFFALVLIAFALRGLGEEPEEGTR